MESTAAATPFFPPSGLSMRRRRPLMLFVLFILFANSAVCSSPNSQNPIPVHIPVRGSLFSLSMKSKQAALLQLYHGTHGLQNRPNILLCRSIGNVAHYCIRYEEYGDGTRTAPDAYNSWLGRGGITKECKTNRADYSK